MIVRITKETLREHLLYDSPVRYTDNITIHPAKMKDIISFNKFYPSITVRKDSIFNDKSIIKMEYLEFLKFSFSNDEFALKYKNPTLPSLFMDVLSLLNIVCVNQEVKVKTDTLKISINNEILTDETFDDLRRIILIQNDIDFDIDEYMNLETLQALEKAADFEREKNGESASLEDYIDSLAISLCVPVDYIKELSIRKFWRYMKRINRNIDYKILKTAEYSGMVKFKSEIPHWTSAIEIEDKYKNLKADENALREKMG